MCGVFISYETPSGTEWGGRELNVAWCQISFLTMNRLFHSPVLLFVVLS